MTLWETRFKNHQAWAQVTQAREIMNSDARPAEDDAEREALAYVGMVVELAEKRREDTDGSEVTSAMLNNFGAAMSNLVNYLSSLQQGAYRWGELVVPAESVVDSLGTWPPLRIKNYFSGVTAAARSYENRLNEAIDRLEERVRKVEAGIDPLDDKQEDLGHQIATEKSRISEAIAEFKTTSSDAIREVSTTHADTLQRHVDDWTSTQTAQEKEACDTLAKLEKHEEEAKNVVQETTSRIVAADYGKYARNKSISAWLCDAAAALLGITGVAFLLYHMFGMDPNEDANIGLSLTRLAVSLGTLGIATVVGRRGYQHHQEARAAKRTDLALRQVLPFTANLDDDERREIILSFTERVFIRGDLDISSDDGSGLEAIKQRIQERRERKGASEEPVGNS